MSGFSMYKVKKHPLHHVKEHIPNIKKEIADQERLTGKFDFSRIEQITSIGSFMWDLRKTYLQCSPNLLAIVNENPHNRNLDKNIFFELIDSNSRNFVLDVMHECIVSNEAFEVYFYLKGDKKKLRLIGYPEGDERHKKIVGLIQDVSNVMEANDALLQGQEEERKRISLELHDSVGQKLIAAKYQLALMRLEPSEDKYLKLDGLINNIVTEVRGITHNLSAQIVLEMGLKNAVAQLLSDTASYLKAKKVYRYELKDKEKNDLPLSENAAKTIYRIVQESLANATKHSCATLLKVSLYVINNQVMVIIKDNGVGVTLNAKLQSGIGLRNIKERVSFLNGFVRFITKPSEGFEINIKIPLRNVINM